MFSSYEMTREKIEASRRASHKLTEIGDFHVVFLVKKEVLGLEIPVNDHVAMAVVDTRDDLLEEAASFRRFQLKEKKILEWFI